MDNRRYSQSNQKFGIKELVVIIAIMMAMVVFKEIFFTDRVFINPKIDRSSKWYVNDLYMSNQYYYENMLNEKEKEMYEDYFERINRFEKDAVYECSVDSMLKVMDAIVCDHPEMINLVGFSYGNDNRIEFIYLTKDEKDLEKKVKRLRRQIYKMSKDVKNIASDYEKEKRIYEILAEKSSYGSRMDRADQSAYSALVDGKTTVCAGYAKAAQILFQTFGMDSHLVVNTDHMWNIINIEDEWYFFDATNSSDKRIDEGISYIGLNQNTNTSSYSSKYLEYFPAISGAKYNYYDYEKKTLTYDKNDLTNLEKIIKDSKKRELEVKINNSIAFENDIEELNKKLNVSIAYYTGYMSGCKVYVIRKK